MDQFPEGKPIRVEAHAAFPLIRDLVTDVSRNYEVKQTHPAFAPKPA